MIKKYWLHLLEWWLQPLPHDQLPRVKYAWTPDGGWMLWGEIRPAPGLYNSVDVVRPTWAAAIAMDPDALTSFEVEDLYWRPRVPVAGINPDTPEAGPQ
jgi:hypothetical protein